MKKCVFIALFIRVCFGAASTQSADDIKIKADNMQYDTSHKKADASGNARLTYVVNNAIVTLKSDTLHAQFDDKGNLIEATASGNVEIDYNDTKLYAAKCVHDFNTNSAVCTGDDVKLMQDKNEVHGTKATLDIPTHVFTMQTNQQDQVTCLVYPKQKENEDKNP